MCIGTRLDTLEYMMSNGKNPLILMMALSVPGAAHALGLGDIHVDSALNERLAAEIDIVGATADELSDLRAAVANREMFLRYGSDRPAFLSSATFKVAQDRQGRPVLSVRSTEAFTEPLVNFIVDLHWRKGELVRQYTLLLDPPGFAASATAVASAPAAPAVPASPEAAAVPDAATPILEPKLQTVARQVDPPIDRDASGERAARKMTRIKVGSKATLRGIAWRVGERSASDLQRMMIAIFRTNASAFDGNINRLHLGAVLTIPSYAEVDAISREEARREFHAQMAVWHSPVRTAHTSISSPSALFPFAAFPTSNASADAPSAQALETDELNKRVQSLEQELVDAQGLLESQRDKLVVMRQQVALAEKTSTVADTAEADSRVTDTPVADAPVPAAKSAQAPPVTIVWGFGLLAGALAALYFSLRRRPPKSDSSRIDTGAAPIASTADGAMNAVNHPRDDAARTQAPADVRNDASDDSHAATDIDIDSDTLESAAPIFDEDTHPMLPVPASRIVPKRVNYSSATISPPEPDHTTINTSLETAKLPIDRAHVEQTRVDTTRLDYNLVDLDMTAQYVQMPSVLNGPVVVKERRTNLADVLKLAIGREPDRHDLRMKLLELYYSAAATNTQAFLEVVQKFARDRDYLHADQWDKIVSMGRQIAPESPLFVEPLAADDDLADCA